MPVGSVRPHRRRFIAIYLAISALALAQSNPVSKSVTSGSVSAATMNPVIYAFGRADFNSDFTETTTCGTSLAPGANCNVSVAFRPTAPGTRSASLTIAGNAGNNPLSVPLTGIGTSNGPVANLYPATLAFALQNVGTTSASQAVTLQNAGNAALTISTIAISGADSTDFIETTTCGSSLTAGSSCTISVSFKPAASARAPLH
jgi:hypothetical protein